MTPLEVNGLQGVGVALGRRLAEIGNTVAHDLSYHRLRRVSTELKRAVEEIAEKDNHLRTVVLRKEPLPDLWTLPPDPRPISGIPIRGTELRAGAPEAAAATITDLYPRDLALFTGSLSKAELYYGENLRVMAYPLEKEHIPALRQLAGGWGSYYHTFHIERQATMISHASPQEGPWQHYGSHRDVIYIHAQTNPELGKFFVKADVSPLDTTNLHLPSDPGGTTVALDPETFAEAVANEPALRAEVAKDHAHPIVMLAGDAGRSDSDIASRFATALHGQEGFHNRDIYFGTSSQILWYRGPKTGVTWDVETSGHGPPENPRALWAHYPAPDSPHWNEGRPMWYW